MAASLLVAVGDVDDLIDAIVERTAGIELGRDMGALIDRAAKERIAAAIDRAAGEGAIVRCDGRAVPAPEGCEGGNWMGPTILDRANPDWECATRELFGPLLTIVRVQTLDDALALERINPYGNATSIFTSSGAGRPPRSRARDQRNGGH